MWPFQQGWWTASGERLTFQPLQLPYTFWDMNLQLYMHNETHTLIHQAAHAMLFVLSRTLTPVPALLRFVKTSMTFLNSQWAPPWRLPTSVQKSLLKYNGEINRAQFQCAVVGCFKKKKKNVVLLYIETIQHPLPLISCQSRIKENKHVSAFKMTISSFHFVENSETKWQY